MCGFLFCFGGFGFLFGSLVGGGRVCTGISRYYYIKNVLVCASFSLVTWKAPSPFCHLVNKNH